jgi:hypothetical protein
MHYDPDYGVFNHAYAAAWQIGRLLALSDANFAKALFDWRREYLNSLKTGIVKQDVEVLVTAALGTSESVPQGSGLLRHLREFVVARMYPMVDQLPVIVPRAMQRAGGELLTPEEIEAIRASGEDPVLALRERVTEHKNS